MKSRIAVVAVSALIAMASCSSAPKADPAPSPASMKPTTSPSATPAPYTPTPSPVAVMGFQTARLVASRDSFEAIASGQRLGVAVVSLSREGSVYRYGVDIALSAVNISQHYVSRFDVKSLMPVSQTMDGIIQGTAVKSRIDIVDGRAKGTSQMPGPAGVTTSTVDLAVPPGTVDDQSIASLIATLDLSDGFKRSFGSLGLSPSELRANDVTVQARETVTVPAGTFETFRVLVHSKDDVVLYMTTAIPRRIVLMRVENGAIELRLIK